MSKTKKMSHIPVLLTEVLEEAKGTTSPVNVMLDVTFGRGGHSAALRNLFSEALLIGLDQDAEAVAFAEQNFADWSNFKMVRGNFHDIKDLISNEMSGFLEGRKFDLILADLGVSSPQLDEGHRGFSFYHDGPLDMRMDQRAPIMAKDIVNTWSNEDLIALFQNYGEIRKPFRVVERIVEARSVKAFETTAELSYLIEKAEGWKKKGYHPATQYFMALRLEVNHEIDRLESSFVALMESLNPGGRFLVITFHSLEDRIVKNLFKERSDLGAPVHKKVIQAEWSEKKSNPRARSAKLRVFEKGSHS